MIATGLAVEIPPGFEGSVRPGPASRAITAVTLVNSPGTIDADYRGPCRLSSSASAASFTIESGERIAQMVIAPVAHAEVVEVEGFSETARGAEGFGSTGR
jgi:dUTP pyrophosphatase